MKDLDEPENQEEVGEIHMPPPGRRGGPGRGMGRGHWGGPHGEPHGMPPHVMKEIMDMKEKIGRLEGMMEVILKKMS